MTIDLKTPGRTPLNSSNNPCNQTPIMNSSRLLKNNRLSRLEVIENSNINFKTMSINRLSMLIPKRSKLDKLNFDSVNKNFINNLIIRDDGFIKETKIKLEEEGIDNSSDDSINVSKHLKDNIKLYPVIENENIEEDNLIDSKN
jgi:hypothetical protein